MDQAYKELFDLYQTDQLEFEKESKEIKEKLKHHTNLFKYNELIPYPDYDDPDFNKKIFFKKEFNRYKTGTDEITQCNKNLMFELSNNQKFLKNFLSPFTPYNGILLFHSVGVGKSCSAISIAERYYDVYQKKSFNSIIIEY